MGDAKETLMQMQIQKLASDINKNEAETQKLNQDQSFKATQIGNETAVANGALWKMWWDRIGSILKSIGSVFTVLLKDLSPYIVLILVIVVLIWIARRSRAPSVGSGGTMRPPKTSWFDSYFLPSYQIRSFTSYFASEPPGTDRPKEVNGRCDNLEWQQVAGSGSGLCVKTYKPNTISWTFDMDKMPELGKIPAAQSDAMGVTSKMQVYIPWEAQGTFYVPQCTKAYFKEVDENGKEIQTPAAYLFEDKGLICKRVEKTSTQYGTAYRPKGTSDLYDYATEGNPKCSV